MTPGPRLLRPTDVGRRLESAVAMIRAELAALPDDVLKEVLGHLIERAARARREPSEGRPLALG